MNAGIASYRSIRLGTSLYLSTSNTKIYYVEASFTQYENSHILQNIAMLAHQRLASSSSQRLFES
jgi:hypothetical protein